MKIIDNRPLKINYYLNIAKEVATRSTCLRRKYGSIIVKNDSIISTGYNGAPRDLKNCCDLGSCRREDLNIPRGTCYELCRSIHSEVNSIIVASKEQMIGAHLYISGIEVSSNETVKNLDCCEMCKRIIINSGITEVILDSGNKNYKIINIQDWINKDESLTDKVGY